MREQLGKYPGWTIEVGGGAGVRQYLLILRDNFPSKVMKNTGKGGGLTLPLEDGHGQYIAKFPSTAFPGVSENEFANLALAAAIGRYSSVSTRM